MPEPTSTPITTRQATLNDISELVAMMQEFYAESDFPLDTQWANASFNAFLANQFYGSIWLVSFNDNPAGYAVLTVRFSMEYGGLDAFLDDLFVRAAYRRRGVAQAAINAVLAECQQRKIRALHVEVGADNPAAQALYKTNGFLPPTDERQLLTARFDRNDAT